MYIVSVFQLLGKETGPEVELEFDYTSIDLFIYLQKSRKSHKTNRPPATALATTLLTLPCESFLVV